MSGSIRLHSKYGVNPTISQCFWCGEDKNELALLGAAYKGEAPKHMVLSYEPCDTCKKNMALGVTLMEADKDPGEDPKPTGRWLVVREEVIRRLFTPESVAANVLTHRKAYLDREGFAKVMDMFKDVMPEDKS